MYLSPSFILHSGCLKLNNHQTTSVNVDTLPSEKVGWLRLECFDQIFAEQIYDWRFGFHLKRLILVRQAWWLHRFILPNQNTETRALILNSINSNIAKVKTIEGGLALVSVPAVVISLPSLFCLCLSKKIRRWMMSRDLINLPDNVDQE